MIWRTVGIVIGAQSVGRGATEQMKKKEEEQNGWKKNPLNKSGNKWASDPLSCIGFYIFGMLRLPHFNLGC